MTGNQAQSTGVITTTAQIPVHAVTNNTNVQQARGATPQKVYEIKKTLIRFDQIIWYFLGLIEILLAFRLILKFLGANYGSGFTNLIYSITTPIVAPFNGIFKIYASGGSVLEWTTIIGGIVYLCVAWGLVYLLNLIYPISPKDVDDQNV